MPTIEELERTTERIISPKEIHRLAMDKGWWKEDRSIPELLCLIHSEVSEALEAYRKEDFYVDKLQEELADVVIRVFDMCEYLNLDIVKAVEKKHEFNKTREYRHGNKRC